VTLRNERFVVAVIAGSGGSDGDPLASGRMAHAVVRSAGDHRAETTELVRLTEKRCGRCTASLLEFTQRLRGSNGEAIGARYEILGESRYSSPRPSSREFNARFRDSAMARRGGWRCRRPGIRCSRMCCGGSESRCCRFPGAGRRHAHAFSLAGRTAGEKDGDPQTVGLLALDGAGGLPVPCAGFGVPFFDQVLADRAIQQSIQESLSTFSTQCRGCVYRQPVTPDSLVLLDELGPGDGPGGGRRAGVAILDRCRTSGRVLARLDAPAGAGRFTGARYGGVLNGSMGFNEETLGAEPTCCGWVRRASRRASNRAAAGNAAGAAARGAGRAQHARARSGRFLASWTAG